MKELKKTIESLKDKVDPVIEIILSNKVDVKFQRITNYQIQTGGKRLRPVLAILSCQMLGGKIRDVVYPAAGLEIMHTYTLIIDDIIDNGELRRNKQTTWVKYGKSIANLISQNYAVSIFEAVSHSKEPMKVLDIFSETLKKITEGQFLDVLCERHGREDESYVAKNRPKVVTIQKYLEMISKKTGALIQASCEVGAVCASGSRQDVKALREFGFNLGIAFQIQDDILDIFGKEKDFGKKIGKDIEERKGGNIILLLAKRELEKTKREKIIDIMKKKIITEKDKRQVVSLIETTKAKEKAEKLKEQYFQRAKKYLRVLPNNQYNDLLSDLADYVIKREK